MSKTNVKRSLRFRAAVTLMSAAGVCALLALPLSAIGNPPPGPAVLVSRHQIVDHIYEYDYVIPTGNDQYHRVGVHRVVQEEDGQPRPSNQAIFMVHGDAWDFNAAFMRGTSS